MNPTLFSSLFLTLALILSAEDKPAAAGKLSDIDALTLENITLKARPLDEALQKLIAQRNERIAAVCGKEKIPVEECSIDLDKRQVTRVEKTIPNVTTSPAAAPKK